ncbi:MAG: helix-turn-helix domain-containing protein [Clostridia bacterium]|nr:helix-turn-helix domain-containing protein [Clostridia bacterium]
MLRKEKELKQEDIANVLGCTQRKISYMEQGVTEPDTQSLVKLADYFGVSVDFLLGRSDY